MTLLPTHLRTAAAAFLCILVVGCGASSNSSSPAPTLTTAVAATTNAQVASYAVTLPKPGNVAIQFGPDTSYGLSTWQQHTPESGPLAVVVLVAGMKANTLYHMQAKVEYDDGSTANDTDHTFQTGALPAGVLPAFSVTPTSGLTPQTGVELVDMIAPASYQVPFVSDLSGNILWTYTTPGLGSNYVAVTPLKLLPNGHFMCLLAPTSTVALSPGIPAGALNALREIDLAGNTVREIRIADLNTRLAAANFNLTLLLFSHDFAALPNGHVLVIANTFRAFDNLPGYPGTTNVLGDVVVDLDQNFNPVWVWNSFDHLDVNRHPMMFPDWTHSNALAYSADDGNFLISIRHQNWILKIDYRDGAGTGNILWKLGYQGDFKLTNGVDPTDWFYAQHDVNFVSSNTTGSFQIALMDNGDDRVFPSGLVCGTNGAPACYTTIPVMQVDENALTASFLFHQILPPSLYSSFAGSTRVQPNGNVEYNLAGSVPNAYVSEVTPTATPQTVWQMVIPGANTYRAYRMPSLYPGVQW